MAVAVVGEALKEIQTPEDREGQESNQSGAQPGEQAELGVTASIQTVSQTALAQVARAGVAGAVDRLATLSFQPLVMERVSAALVLLVGWVAPVEAEALVRAAQSTTFSEAILH